MLSTPPSSAENWIEFYRRQVERYGVDRDDIQAPAPDLNFGFTFSDGRSL
jgi:hypothetical protein